MRTTLTSTASAGRNALVAVLVPEGSKPALPRNAPPASAWAADLKDGSDPVLLRGERGERWLLLKLPAPKRLTPTDVRSAAATARKSAEKLGRSVLTVDLAALRGDGEHVLAASEGAHMAGYDPAVLRKDRQRHKVSRLHLVTARASVAARAAAERGRIAAEANLFVRELQNLPANRLHPKDLAAKARSGVRGSSRIQVKVLGRRQLAALGCGALLGVAQGSAHEPQLVHLRYRPRGRARARVAVVGKGVCFDTGGISIKPAARMDEMKFDMSGAAAVAGLFHALAHGIELPYEIHGVMGCVENMPGNDAQRPGDIVTAMNGTTIEVLNTDAEGRLVLADCLSYVVDKVQPDRIVDLATLTGAAVIALGHNASAILGNDDKLRQQVQDAGERVDERCWPLPLWDVHKELAKGDYADLKNIYSPNEGAGTIAGAAFLSSFVGDTPWVHIDIAATAYEGPSRPYYSRGGRGTGVRLLLELLRD
ncbi:MAG: leucyl aminopeptidase [Planctomycetota bacterium]|nr:MAG: leucyl aminopeptidase [Planctomycetota bacterium]